LPPSKQRLTRWFPEELPFSLRLCVLASLRLCVSLLPAIDCNLSKNNGCEVPSPFNKNIRILTMDPRHFSHCRPATRCRGTIFSRALATRHPRTTQNSPSPRRRSSRPTPTKTIGHVWRSFASVTRIRAAMRKAPGPSYLPASAATTWASTPPEALGPGSV